MIVRFRLGNITETRPAHEKLGHHVSAGRKRDGFSNFTFPSSLQNTETRYILHNVFPYFVIYLYISVFLTCFRILLYIYIYLCILYIFIYFRIIYIYT